MEICSSAEGFANLCPCISGPLTSLKNLSVILTTEDKIVFASAAAIPDLGRYNVRVGESLVTAQRKIIDKRYILQYRKIYNSMLNGVKTISTTLIRRVDGSLHRELFVKLPCKHCENKSCVLGVLLDSAEEDLMYEYAALLDTDPEIISEHRGLFSPEYSAVNQASMLASTEELRQLMEYVRELESGIRVCKRETA